LQKRDVSLVLCLGDSREQQGAGPRSSDLQVVVSEQRIFRTSPVFVEVEVRAGGDDVAVQGPGLELDLHLGRALDELLLGELGRTLIEISAAPRSWRPPTVCSTRRSRSSTLPPVA